MNKWNIVFLVDKNPFSKIVLLKRAENKTFAPGFYTGVGGKVEEEEGLVGSAKRELKEETGIEGVKLTEFARAILNDSDSLHCFWGVYENEKLPISDDGTLEWIKREELLEKKIIPSTVVILTQWKKRNFDLNSPFTVYLTEINTKHTVRNVKLEDIKPGLR